MYLIKFRLIQNRAMTLIKNHVLASMKATTNQILAQIEVFILLLISFYFTILLYLLYMGINADEYN